MKTPVELDSQILAKCKQGERDSPYKLWPSVNDEKWRQFIFITISNGPLVLIVRKEGSPNLTRAG